MIYAVVNTNGGVGKTTTAVHLATMLARTERTLLIDGDPQASAASWAAWRRATRALPTTTCLAGKAILSEGKTLSEGFAHTVAAAGGRDSVGSTQCPAPGTTSDCSVGASNLDAAAMTDLLEVIDMAKDYNSDLQVRIFLTRIDSRTKDAAEMLAFLHEQKLPVLSSRACERVAYRRAIGEGAIVQELGKDPSSSQEMEAFLAEVTA